MRRTPASSPEPSPDDPPRRRPPANAGDRRRVHRAVTAWAALTLGGVVLLVALTLWHLVRRGRLLRERLGQPRVVRWPELPEPPAPPPS